MSKLPCGFNAAVYFVKIDQTGHKGNADKLFSMFCREINFDVDMSRLSAASTPPSTS